MNTYEIEVDGLTRIPYRTTAETAAKAKYQCFYYFTQELNYDIDFRDFLQSIEYCKAIHRFKPSDLFGDRAAFDHMKESRGIEFAYMGMKVEVGGRPGVIVGANHSMNLDICFDGEYWTSNCHPHFLVKYFSRDGSVINEF